MVRDDGILKVLDFGIAGQWDSDHMESSGRLSGSGGTLDYMSPEQARGEQATSASDVFSMGLVLYELATGTHPFRSASPIDTLRAIADAEPKPPSSFDRKIPAGLGTLLLRMLHKDPGNRPSASEVEQQLSLAAASERGRHAHFTMWVAVALALIAVAGVATYILRDRLFPEREPQFLQLTHQVNENRVTAAAISADGKTLLFATLSGAVYRRRTSDGLTQPLQMPRGLRVDRIAWFKDGSKILLEGSMTACAGPIRTRHLGHPSRRRQTRTRWRLEEGTEFRHLTELGSLSPARTGRSFRWFPSPVVTAVRFGVAVTPLPSPHLFGRQTEKGSHSSA